MLLVLPDVSEEEECMVAEGKEGLSWGAGEGTMAMAALMMSELALEWSKFPRQRRLPDRSL